VVTPSPAVPPVDPGSLFSLLEGLPFHIDVERGRLSIIFG
jgi:hypothetical protein